MSSTKSSYNQGNALLLGQQSSWCNNQIRLFNYYTNLTLNRFKWSNLPNGMEGRHIELALFKQGEGFFYEDPIRGFVCLPSTPQALNYYGDPTRVIVTGVGISENLSIDKGVRILDNDLASAGLLHISHYVDLMDYTETTIYQNLKQQKFPYIIPTTKQNELTMRNIMKKNEEFTNTIFVDEKLSKTINSEDGIKVLRTDAPYLLDKLQDFKHDIEAELYTYLGLNNANTDKKERMLVDEVNVNNGQILMSLDLCYKTRQKAVEEINKKFGLNITVEKTIDDISNKVLEGGEENGNRNDGE